MLRWWCGSLQGHCTYGALTSPISLSLPPHSLALHTDMLNFPSSNYPCNLIIWCQLKHRLSCQAVMALTWLNMFSHQSNSKAECSQRQTLQMTLSTHLWECGHIARLFENTLDHTDWVLFYHIAAAAAKTRCLFNLALSCGLRISLAFQSSKMSIYQRLIRVCKELPFSSSCPWFLFYWPPYHSATSCFQLSFHHHFWSRNRKQATDLGLQTHV